MPLAIPSWEGQGWVMPLAAKSSGVDKPFLNEPLLRYDREIANQRQKTIMVELTPNPSYSLTLRFRLPNRAGMLAGVVGSIASVGGNLGQIDLVEQSRYTSIRDVTVDASSTEHAERIVQAVKALAEIELLEVYDRTFNLHRGGKIRIESRLPLKHQSDLAMAYTPGVGRICNAIAEDPNQVYNLTVKGNMVAIVTDGSAVLGLGNLGPEAALPVMEGKAMLFKEFAGIDAFPICLNTQDVDEIVETVKRIAPVFGGVNLEDIAAPRCFEIERRLRAETDIPIFHDDQHGTAIVTLAALINALRLVNKSLEDIRIVMNGAGAAGLAIARLLQKSGAQEIIICDSKGIISRDSRPASGQTSLRRGSGWKSGRCDEGRGCVYWGECPGSLDGGDGGYYGRGCHCHGDGQPHPGNSTGVN